MKTLLHALIILSITGCNHRQPDKATWDNINRGLAEAPPPKNQTPPVISYVMGDITFLFSELIDPHELGLYQSLEVKLKDSTHVKIESKTIELEGQSFKISPDYVYLNDSVSYFLIPANNRPEPNYNYILRYDGRRIELLGNTEPLTKELFGDIDNDGILEIGGFNTHCQGLNTEDFNDPEFCLDHFRVFEIQHDITRDLETEAIERKNLTQERLQNQKE